VRIRYCTSCHEEYRPDIVSCAECGALLEDRDDEITPPVTSPQPPVTDKTEDVPEGFEPVHTSRGLDDLPLLADALVAAGIECRIREARREQRVVGYRLLVRAQDRAAALAVLKAQLDPQVATEFDPERGYARCPACDGPLQPRAPACPECGLPLVAAEVGCPECGATADATADHCPACGCALGDPT
jgi:hypothetical protein